MSEEQGCRPLLSRLGIVLLNIPAPGLGVLRVQRLRAAIPLLLVPHLTLGLVILAFAVSPTLGFWARAAIVLGALAVLLVAWTIAMTISWRGSRATQPVGPWWSRGEGIVCVFILGVAAAWVSCDIALSFYRSFYTPSSGMSPTLMPGDQILATMRGPGELRRGDVVLVEADGGAIYVSRIAGLPNDRISLTDGIVTLNGQQVLQRLVRTDPIPPGERGIGTQRVRRLAEQFPGEAMPHEIYDAGQTQGDEHPPTRIPPGHVFALGDNRDNAADSRFPPEQMGLALIPLERVRGRVLSHRWGSSRPMGTAIGGR